MNLRGFVVLTGVLGLFAIVASVEGFARNARCSFGQAVFVALIWWAASVAMLATFIIAERAVRGGNFSPWIAYPVACVAIFSWLLMLNAAVAAHGGPVYCRAW